MASGEELYHAVHPLDVACDPGRVLCLLRPERGGPETGGPNPERGPGSGRCSRHRRRYRGCCQVRARRRPDPLYALRSPPGGGVQGQGGLVRGAQPPRVAVRALQPGARGPGSEMNRSMLWLLVPLLIGGMSCSRPPDSAEKAAAAAPGSNTVQLCEHQVPADLCTQCTPALIPAFKSQGDWCAEHGVPESQCGLCHPDLTFTAQAAKDWCKEHAIAESKCTKCHPNLVAGFIAAGDYCREHGYPASACPKCHPELVTAAGEEPPVFPEPGTKVVL